MLTVKIKQEQIERAKKLYSFQTLNGSITNGRSNIYGAIGEVVICDLYKASGYNVINENTFDYDLIIQDWRVDVKTKKTTVEPQGNYLCSISNFNIKQQCDFYFFVRVHINLDRCYLLGYKSKADFFKEATFNKKGSEDLNGWTFKDDCWNLEIKKLNKFTH